MKKLLVTVLLAVSTSAMANEQIELGYRYDENRDTKVTTDNITLAYKNKINKTFDFNLGLSTNQNSQDNINTRLQAGLTANYQMLYLTGFVGQSLRNGQDSVSYWTLEPGIKFNINDKWATKFGYRYRDSFDSNVANERQDAWRASVTYKVNKDWNLVGKYDFVTTWQDHDVDRFGISVVKKF